MHGHTMPEIAKPSYSATFRKRNAVEIGILHVKVVAQCQK